MTEVTFGRLVDLPLREAWKHEALEFTPWLAENIDHLSDAIGIPLELTGQEVRVESFAADILARNPSDDSVVLIENQLEQTDHTHLGQIMTYLAGLEAQTVVWIAPEFRQPHLSAIRWLNEHTADGFSFFAVKARVVRIGDSPFAPIFEVVEKPNDWDREIKRKASTDGSAYYDIKQEFWEEFLRTHPAMATLGVAASRYPNAYITVGAEPKVEISIWIGRDKSGIYVRSGWGEPVGPVSEVLEPHRAALEDALGAPLGPGGRGQHFLAKRLGKGHDRREAWPEIMTWMDERVAEYRSTLEPILKGGTA
ncbi:hypothetical protein [Citreimonas salinaria]|uniref:DUF4268 domain-containing protein n=1 Tax=Citreimonas salinaria TaxID=321339 RepID=A0A1H3IDU5_9RHOB|nr:hypothetical protein [Citreimonas salinaria]SDY25807.1 hypothetical protein SAMN05444340_1052 [Citreimonas salinaria]